MKLVKSAFEQNYMNNKNEIYSVGIKFADNDFGSTIRGFLQNIRIVLKETKAIYLHKMFEKHNFVEMYNQSIYGCYLLYQNKFEYQAKLNPEYLNISVNQVCFNEEVLKVLEDPNTNQEFHYYSLFEDQIYTV
jgi:hypothetical protein